MKKVIYILALALGLGSCKKDFNNALDFKGTYTGTFVITNSTIYHVEKSEINLAAPNYSVIEGYKKASGSFRVIDKMNVTFTDKNFWTAEFDPNILLNGNYRFEALGDSLILTKSINNSGNTTTYQYRLKRNSN
jgi:hypothetical protein